MTARTTAWRRRIAAARARLHARRLPIVQTAAAATGAWYLAVLLLPDPRPAFAAIAAVIAIGATYGQRVGRAVQLVGGVVLGITVADLILDVIGEGGWQLGVMVILAMSAAVLLGGGELLVAESAVSAILLVAIGPGAADGFSPNRILEAVIGGGVALAVSSVFFPPDPALAAGRAVQGVFEGLGRALGRMGAALADGDEGPAERALAGARSIEGQLRAVEDELAAGRETARLTPPRRAAREQLGRYERSLHQVDFAVRNTRVLARHVLRSVRDGEGVPAALPEALGDLSEAVWELAASYDAPGHAADARRLALRAAERAALPDARPDAAVIAGQIRSVAVDLVRAAELVAGEREPAEQRPTQELLIRP